MNIERSPVVTWLLRVLALGALIGLLATAWQYQLVLDTLTRLQVDLEHVEWYDEQAGVLEAGLIVKNPTQTDLVVDSVEFSLSVGGEFVGSVGDFYLQESIEPLGSRSFSHRLELAQLFVERVQAVQRAGGDPAWSLRGRVHVTVAGMETGRFRQFRIP